MPHACQDSDLAPQDSLVVTPSDRIEMSSALAVFVELDFVENEHTVAFRHGPRHVDVALFE